MDTNNGQNEPIWAIKAQPILLDIGAKDKAVDNDRYSNNSSPASASSSSLQPSSSSPVPPHEPLKTTITRIGSTDEISQSAETSESPESSTSGAAQSATKRTVRFSLPEGHLSPKPSEPLPGSSNDIYHDDDDDDDDEDDDEDYVQSPPSKKRKSRAKKPEKASKSPKEKKAKKTKANAKKVVAKTVGEAVAKIGAKIGKVTKKAPARKNSTAKKLCNNFKLLLQTNKTDFPQRLPVEILCKIFHEVNEDEGPIQNMIGLTQVCETWRNAIISNSEIWTCLNLEDLQHSFPHYLFEKLSEDSKLFRNLRHLDLPNFTEKDALQILHNVAKLNDNLNLESLQLFKLKNASWQIFPAIMENAPKLKHLNLSSFYSLNVFVRAKMQPMFDTVGPHLRSLNLSRNRIPQTALESIVAKCGALTLLNISNELDDQHPDMGFTISLEKLQNACPKLRVLHAAKVKFLIPNPRANFPGFPELEELYVPFGSHKDNVVELLTKSSTKLTLLDIRDCNEFSFRSLLKIPSWAMEHIMLGKCRGIESDSTELVFEKWRDSLIDVDLSLNTGPAGVDTALRTLADTGPSKSKLKTVNLRGSSVSMEALINLLKRCPQIESVDLQSCRGMPRGIKRDYSGPEFVQLREDLLNNKYTLNE